MRKHLFILLAVVWLASPVSAQSGVRIDNQVTQAQVPSNAILGISHATINFCNAPANAVPCTNKATTYTDATLGVTCSTSTQVVLAGTSSCVATTDQFGNWGVWVASGQYAYTITTSFGSSGPFPVTASGGSGANIALNIMGFGAFANARSGSDFSMTSGSAALTSPGQGFTVGDVGKIAVVAGAGAAGATLVTTVASFQSSTQVTLAASASTTVTGATATTCNSDVPAINAAITAAQAFGILRTNGGQAGYPSIFFPPGNYCLDAPISVKSSPWVGPPGNAWAQASTFSWVGSPGATVFTKTSDPGGTSYWAMENFRFLYSGDLPGTWLDLTSNPIDVGLTLNGIFFGPTSGDAIKVANWVNFHLDRVRFDGVRGYAIRFTPTAGVQNQADFSIRDWTYDNNAENPSTSTPGIFLLDNTANVANMGTLHFADARIEVNQPMVSPNCIVCLVNPNSAANGGSAQLDFDNLNIQPSGGANPTLVFSSSTQSALVPASIVINNVNAIGASPMTILGAASTNPWNNYQISAGPIGQIRFALLDASLASGDGVGAPAQMIGVGLTAPNATISSLTSGDCVQAGTSGLLTTTASACGNAFSGGLGASFQDATEIAAPANPAAGNDRLFLNSTTHLLDCHTSTGASCAPSGGSTLGTITPQPATAGDVVCANSTPTWTDCVQGIAGRTVSGTSDTIVSGDRGTTIAYTSATAVAVSLTSAATLGNNAYFTVNAQGAGAVTLTPGAGQINGAASLVMTQGQTCYIHSPDNVNYTADCSNGQLVAGTNITFTPSAHGLTIAASGGGAAVINGVSCGTCNLGSLFDTNGNSSVLTGTTTSAVDQITVTNAATGGIPSIAATGTDTNIPLNLSAKASTVNFPTSSLLIGGSTTATAQVEISTGGNVLLPNSGRITWTSTGAVNGSIVTSVTPDSGAGIVDIGTGAQGSVAGLLRTGNTVQLTSNFTTTSTTLVTITGLSWTFPATNHNYGFDCRGSYSQATAAAANAFGVQAATTAPTNLMASMRVNTSLTNAGVNATLPTLATTTATNIGTFTPGSFGAIGTVADIFTFDIHGQLQQAPGATTLNIMALSGSASDALTIYAGTSCTLEP